MSPSRGQLTTRRTLFAAIATVLVLHLIVYRSTYSLRTQHSLHLLHKRTLTVVEHHHNNHRPHSPSEHEPQTEALIDWLKLYKQSTRTNKPFLFGLMTVWLVFLFAFVGICASEFFCPNLSHIASRLGLSESVAGVTFLAFSNGSPDVFSTFSALKSDAGSLAIGELIGAASFIVSVVAGSMALITPFRVARHTFLRDVGFFTLAVLLTLTILYDSHIHLWEALTMVGLYIVYVAYVGVGSWWESRRDEKRRKIREAREEYDVANGLGFQVGLEQGESSDDEEEERTFGEGGDIEWEPDQGVIRLPISGTTTPRSTRSISPAYSTDSIIYHHRASHSAGSLTPPLLSHSHSRSRSTSLINPSTPHTHRSRPPPTPLLLTPSLSTSATPQKKGKRVVRPSLLGAIEFRDVVNSLSSERNSSFNARDVLGVLGGGAGKEERGGGGGRPRMHSRTRSNSSARSARSPRRDQEGEGEGEVQWDWNGWGSTTSSEGNSAAAKGRKRASTSPQGMGGGLRLQGEDDVLARGVLERMGGGEEDNETGSEGAENPWEEELEQRAKGIKKVPSILLTSANGSDTLIPTSTSNMEEGGSSSITVTREDGTSTIRQSLKSPSSPPTRRIPSRRRLLLSATLSALFPSLDQFTSKSIIGKITAIMCVPALLVLNLTLPVAEEPSGEVGSDECWEEKEDEEDRIVRGIPKGIRLPDDGTGDDGSLLERRSIDDGSSDEEEERIPSGRSIGGQAAERVGRKLHSPAVAHPHSHHLTNSHPHDPTQDALPSFPWSNPTSNLPTPQSNAPLHSPSSYFKIKTSSEQGTINRISSNSSGEDEGEEMSEEMEERLREREECLAGRKVTRCLTAVQCTLGPIFCTCALFADELEWYQPLLALLLGLFFATLAYRFFHDPRHPGSVTLCFIGFGIAMVWILMIVNEVVGVLQTFGHIFGISDAILGLTIFAMGNSLGDLVANATVARMGYPSMAIAACFGGPMLNILLGVGLSGTYLIASSPTHEPIHVDMGRTLMVSGVGLFAILAGSLVVVPMNGYKMSKRIGAILIGAYTVVLSINVAAEIWL